MANARVSRGRRTNVAVANWLREHGHPDAEPTYGSEPGRDIKNLDRHAIEVKARYGFDFPGWLRQARKNASADRPCVILRMNGQGEASVGDYLVVRRLEDDELNKLREN